MNELIVEGQKIKITNPEKLLWPEVQIRKIDYLQYLIQIAPYLLSHTKDRVLTSIRYPNGIGKPSFYQKHLPKKAPDFVDTLKIDGDTFINLNSLPTLLWLGNLAALEFHTTFNRGNENELTSLVFDLDPSEGQSFDDVRQCALLIHQELQNLGIKAYPKTSGATGLQIFIPTKKYTFEQARKINTFFGKYFVQKYPEKMTIERQIKKRGSLLYFDYLQMWRGKNIISVYSPRAVPHANLSMPIEWNELEVGLSPSSFTLMNAAERLSKKGDLFDAIEKFHAINHSTLLDQILYNEKHV
ncbi:MAG: non-homologous end-joining DNA ligase [Peptostreptococcales bacterium]